MSTASLENRLLRIEGMLGLKPTLELAAGSEFWIIRAEGDRAARSLAYWGPYGSAGEAAASDMYQAEFGCLIVEVAA